MQLDIGGILAKCFSCGCNDFAPLGFHSAERPHRLACTDCCTEVTLDDLLAQIARTAMGTRTVVSRLRAPYPVDYE